MATVRVAAKTPIISRTWGFPTKAMLAGGLLAGILDGLDAVVYFGATRGASPDRVFRYVAGGLVGLETARHGGWGVVLLGIALHFLIALGAAAIYCTVTLYVPPLLRRPFLWGPLFGIAVYLFMDFVVVPLSQLPPQGHWSSTAVFINEILIHMFGVGLPIVWFAARSCQNVRQKSRLRS